jgi:hypothetical protein
MKMLMLRRSLLKMMGMAPVAAASVSIPTAASVVSSTSSLGLGGSVVAAAATGGTDRVGKLLKKKAKDSLLRTLRPEWWVSEIKKSSRERAIETVFGDARMAEICHIDVLVRKATSKSGKVNIIQDRFEAERLAEDDYLTHRLAKSIWEKETGNESEDFYD